MNEQTETNKTPIDGFMASTYVLCAAIWFDDNQTHIHQPRNISSGFVICGHRHHNCFMTANIFDTSPRLAKMEKCQGFITNDNLFVDRKVALHIAISKNQVLDMSQIRGDNLYSEYLY